MKDIHWTLIVCGLLLAFALCLMFWVQPNYRIVHSCSECNSDEWCYVSDDIIPTYRCMNQSYYNYKVFKINDSCNCSCIQIPDIK
jgi:hypothetical protein